jgi:2-desacetyl-2-hydroxyethyl bacteriochlorophyllide A dehydrogenase
VTTARYLTFAAPGMVEIRSEPVPPPGEGQALVETLASGISAGTELLILRGEAPDGMAADASLPYLGGTLDFPVRYGYAAVGRVAGLGPQTDPSLAGQTVFAFHPHQTRFLAAAESLVRLPPNLPPDHAVLLPNLETAVGLVHDGRPVPGDRIAVFGQGVVGLLTTALLARLPLERLVTFDRHAIRRQTSTALGAHASHDPASTGAVEELGRQRAEDPDDPGFDLSYELTGDPATLNQAVAACGYDGRVVVGSWYGRRRALLDLGGHFHRNRIRLISSQVSTLDPALRGRWTHRRRLRYALSLLQVLPVAGLVSHRVPFEQAASAYRLLDQQPDQALQVVLTYDAATRG